MLRNLWPETVRARWVAFVVFAAASSVAGFVLDDWAANLAAVPIRSGQTKATLVALKFFGDGAPIVLLTLLAVAVAPQRKGAAGLALLAALVTGLIVDQGKKLTARSRPWDTLPAPASESWRLADNAGRNSSFPSGHSATAFAFARGMSLAFPPVAPVAYAAATGTALSRMHELRHYLSDCIVGGLLGWLVATSLFGLRSAWFSRTPVTEKPEDTPDVLPLARSA
jgi:membrane-associated phospholipid phosphatase